MVLGYWFEETIVASLTPWGVWGREGKPLDQEQVPVLC